MDRADIAAVTPADDAAWLPLWRGYQQFYKTEIPEAVSQMTWQRFLDPAQPMHAALAWRGGTAVGMVHWIFHRSCWTVEDSCYLQDLYVAPATRGAGVGRALIEHVYVQARAAGATRVHWLTHESNATAMQLYDRIAERSGFINYRKNLPT